MIEAARLGVYVTAEGVDETRKKVGGLGETLSGVAGKAMVAGGVLTATVTRSLLGLGEQAVNAASDVLESMNKVDVVFGGSAGVVKQFADTAATSIGLSEQAALDAAGTMGNMYVQLGVGGDQAATFSQQMMVAASDLASFHNAAGGTEEVLATMQSAFRGEYDAIQRYIPTINAAAVEQMALKMTGKELTKELTATDKALAAQAIILQNMGPAAGDFARTSDGLANSQRIMQASMQDLAATIGMQLLPIKLQLVQAVQQVVTWFQQLNPSTQGMVVVFGALAAVAGPLLMVLGTMATAVAAIGLPVIAVVAALGLLAAAWATNFGGIRDLTMPIIEQIQAWFGEAIPAAIAKFQEIWAKLVEFFAPTVERIRAAVGPMVESFSPLGEKIAGVWAIVEPVLSALANIIGTVVVVAFNLLMEVVAAVMPSIGTIIGNAIDIATTVLQTLSTVVTEVVAIVKALIEGDWAAVWEHAQVILTTLWEAVETIFGEILDTITVVIGDILVAIQNWLGNLNTEWAKKFGELVTAAKAKMVEIYNAIKTQLASIVEAVKSFNLRDAGAALIDGMMDGIRSRAAALVSAAQGVVQNAINAAKNLLGIHSPSTVFLEIGRNIMTGLMAGIEQETPASVVAMSEAMSAIVDAVGKVLGIFVDLNSITVIGDVAGKMKTFKDQVVAIIRELADLAGMLAGMPEGANWASAKAGLDAVVGVFEPLLKSLATITGLGDMKLLTDIPARIAFIKASFLALIQGVADMTNSPEMAQLTTATETGLNVSLFAQAIEGIFGPLQAAAKAWETIKGFNFSDMKVEPVLRWLASFGAMAVQAVEWARSWAGTAGEGMGAFIAGVGAAVKSLADVAKAWEVIQKFNWSALDAGDVVEWLASLGGLAIKAMNWASSWATPGAGLDAFAQAVKVSLGGLVEVAKGWEVLQNFVKTPWGPGGVERMVEWLASLGGLAVTALKRVSEWSQFQTLDAKMKDLAAYMQSAFGAMSAAVQFTNELDGWKDLPDLEGKFDRLRRAIEYIVPQFELTRKAVGELAYEEVGKFAQALVDVANGIQAALNLMQTDMSNLSVPDTTFWEPLNDWIKATMTSFANWLAANPNLTTQSPMVTAFGQAIGGLFGGLRSAIEVAAMLPKDWAAPADSVWTPFTDWVKRTFESFYDYVTEMLVLDPRSNHPTETPRFTVGGLDLVGKFGAALSGLFGGLKTALELAFNLPANWTAPDASAWGSFVGWVQRVFDSFLAWVTRTHTDANGNVIPFDTVGLDLVNAFGGALSALMGGLASSFAVFSGLIGFVAPSQAQLNAFADAVKVVFESFAVYAKTTLVVSANAAVKAFGEAMGALFSGLNTALTFTSAVYKESPGFFAFLASASAGAGGDFQVKMGLINTAITETMSRFKTNVVDKVKTDWLPAANTLLSAVQSVFGVLNTALGIFKDLNTVGMPDSKTITGFIDAVVGLFTKLTQQLGLVPGAVGTSMSAVRLVVTDPTTLQRFSEDGTTAAMKIVGGFKWGLTSDGAATLVTEGVNGLANATRNAVFTAFGIHSPSTVFMAYGQLLAEGMGIGLNQGLNAMGLPGMNGQPFQMAYAGLPTQTVRVQVGGDIRINGQRVTPEMADEIAYLLTQRLRLKG